MMRNKMLAAAALALVSMPLAHAAWRPRPALQAQVAGAAATTLRGPTDARAQDPKESRMPERPSPATRIDPWTQALGLGPLQLQPPTGMRVARVFLYWNALQAWSLPPSSDAAATRPPGTAVNGCTRAADGLAVARSTLDGGAATAAWTMRQAAPGEAHGWCLWQGTQVGLHYAVGVYLHEHGMLVLRTRDADATRNDAQKAQEALARAITSLGTPPRTDGAGLLAMGQHAFAIDVAAAVDGAQLQAELVAPALSRPLRLTLALEHRAAHGAPSRDAAADDDASDATDATDTVGADGDESLGVQDDSEGPLLQAQLGDAAVHNLRRAPFASAALRGQSVELAQTRQGRAVDSAMQGAYDILGTGPVDGELTMALECPAHELPEARALWLEVLQGVRLRG